MAVADATGIIDLAVGELTGEPGSPEFVADYVAAENNPSSNVSQEGTFNGLIRHYTLSTETRGFVLTRSGYGDDFLSFTSRSFS